MKNTWNPTRLTALGIALALVVGTRSYPAYGHGAFSSEGPTATPRATPQLTSTPVVLKAVHGTACVDRDLNGTCSPDEARIPNVIIRTIDGAVAVTDGSGQYAMQVPLNSVLDLSLPSGYISVNGNLHHLRIQMSDADLLDIALTVDSATAPALPGSLTIDSVVPGLGSVNPIYIVLAVLGFVLLLLVLLLATALLAFRRLYRRSLDQQGQALRDQRGKDLGNQSQTSGSWQAVAEQLMADALHRTVSVDGDAGILDASADPNPRFSVTLHDGTKVVFTTDPRMMRKAKLVRRGDRIVQISSLSATSHADAGVLWDYVLGARNMRHVTPPSSARWFIVVRTTGPKASAVPFVQRSPVPSTGGHE